MQVNADKLVYIPIQLQRTRMEPYLLDEFSRMVYDIYEGSYPRLGYHPPWIGYFAMSEDTVVGVGGYKGRPVRGCVEIAYGTVPAYEGRGVSSNTCGYLTRLALSHQPDLRVIAHTLTMENASTSILRKHGFVFAGIINDPEDGEVWEWEFKSERESVRK